MKLRIFTRWIIAALLSLSVGVADGGEEEAVRTIVPAPEDARFCHLPWPKVLKADNGNLGSV